MTDDREGTPSARRRISIATMPEAPYAKQAERASSRGSPFAIDVGDAAPLFTLPNESGAEVPLAALRGGPVIVMFGPARDHETLARSLADARTELAREGASALLVVAGDVQTAAPLAHPHGRDALILADRDGSVHRAYGVLDPLIGRPRLAVFLLDRAGDVARVYSQPLPERALRLALDALDLAR